MHAGKYAVELEDAKEVGSSRVQDRSPEARRRQERNGKITSGLYSIASPQQLVAQQLRLLKADGSKDFLVQVENSSQAFLTAMWLVGDLRPTDAIRPSVPKALYGVSPQGSPWFPRFRGYGSKDWLPFRRVSASAIHTGPVKI